MYSGSPDPEGLEEARRQSSSVSESHCGVGKKKKKEEERVERRQTLHDVTLNGEFISKDKVFPVSK